jgi:ABC-type molybdenum transport system ATPase subunit/photorepair protein PhrA
MELIEVSIVRGEHIQFRKMNWTIRMGEKWELAQKPHLHILDDPLSGLDACARKTFQTVVAAAMRIGIDLDFMASSFEDQPCRSHWVILLVFHRCRW